MWADCVSQGIQLICTDYILVETFALVQNRLGMEAIRVLQEDMQPAVDTEWIDEECHHAGVSALLTAGRRKLSLVDCVSFETIRRLGIDTAFVFDHHFEKQGFKVIP